jgi:hypothetical protein
MSTSELVTGQAATRARLGEWPRFLLVLFMLVAPSLMLGAALEALAWRIGETMSMPLIAKWQDGAPDRVWRGGDGHSYLTYKLARIATLKPEIIVLGPSRANAFRGDAVAPHSFYNAGLTAWTFDQYRRFLELATRGGYAPKVLIFNLDYWMFAAGFDHYWVNRFDERPAIHVDGLLRLIGQLRDDPLRLWRSLAAADHVHGLYALLAGDGFHADGSLPGAAGSSDPQRLTDDGTGPGVPPVELADRIASEQVAKFEQFVAFAKAKHIGLVGIQLPYYGKILSGLADNPRAGIWREFESEAWRQRLAEAGVVFFDFADMPDYRDKPEFFTDSLDPDARVAADIMQRVTADPRVRALLAADKPVQSR